MFSQDSTSTDDVVDEMDEGFVDDSMAVPSISEHALTVGVEAPGVEEQEDDEQEEHEDEHDEEESDGNNEVSVHKK